MLAAGCSSPTAPSQMATEMPATSAPPTPSPSPSPSPLPNPAPESTARYAVTFDSSWSASTHPTDFPASAHWSGLIGGTHTSAVSFWTEGSLASEGIRRMAERGSKSPLDDEVSQAIAGGTAQQVLSGPALGTSPGSVSMEFEISEAFPLVTLVTMVAPSPDWFAGVSGLPLFQNSRWVDEVRVELYAFDAGTDSGVTYSAPDLETVPRQPIARITGYPVATNGAVRPFGTFTFRRIQ
jgi:hypothetical protein